MLSGLSGLSGLEIQNGSGDKDEEEKQDNTPSRGVLSKWNMIKGQMVIMALLLGSLALLYRPCFRGTRATASSNTLSNNQAKEEERVENNDDYSGDVAVITVSPPNSKYNVKPGVLGSFCHEVEGKFKPKDYEGYYGGFVFLLSNCTCEDSVVTQVDMEHVAAWDDWSALLGSPEAVTETSEIRGPVFCALDGHW